LAFKWIRILYRCWQTNTPEKSDNALRIAFRQAHEGHGEPRRGDLADRNGFASAVLVPVHSGIRHSRISLLCLGSPTSGYFEGDGFGRFKLGARTLACEVHEWWSAQSRRELLSQAHITAGDLELLRHQCQGHSSKRIAAELCVSKSSINSRFQRINVKLGVPNRRMAARLAAECGLILP